MNHFRNEKHILLPKSELDLESDDLPFVKPPDAVTDGSQNVKRTAALMRGLKLVLRHHNAKENVISSLTSQVHRYLDRTLDEETWIKQAKSLLSDPLAKYLDNELPPAPLVGRFTPKGLLRRWFKPRLNAFNRRNTHLWSSWLQCKRSALPASDDLVDKAYLKHASVLSREDDGDDTVISRIMSNRTYQQHLDAVRAGISNFYLSDIKPPVEYVPSLRSSLTHTRVEGGALGAMTFDFKYRNSYILSPLHLVKMEFRKVWKLRLGKQTSSLETVSYYEHSQAFLDSWNEHLNFPQLLSGDSLTPLDCKITGIIEPLKVRVISRGPAREYYYCKRLQKALHSTLRGMPAYTLIGRPLLGGDTMNLKREQDTEWFSIDYSAATDNLSWKYSERILTYILQDIPVQDRELALRVLGPHNMIYPSGANVMMKRGQLMGSILSFPILCLANMGVYLDVTESWHNELSYNYCDRMSSVYINGDDQLYAAPRNLWPRHKLISDAVGLELSIGKAYVHPTYLNINSTSIHHRYGDTPYQIDYLNTGLFYGQSKVMKVLDEMSENSEDPFVNFSRLLRGALPGRQADICRQFLAHIPHKRVNDGLKARWYDCLAITGPDKGYAWIRRNIFLPISLGGCGVQVPEGFVNIVKPIHYRIAAGMKMRMVNPSPRPLPGRDYVPLNVEPREPNYGLISSPSVSVPTLSYSRDKVEGLACELWECERKPPAPKRQYKGTAPMCIYTLGA